jgi:hypothetical protein
MPTNNGLKVCTFNAKCDHIDYKCCAKDVCYKNNCSDLSDCPDSLIAALIAVTILPSKADIYNIQNVKNKCVVEHLLKEIARVKDIMDEVQCNSCDELTVPYLQSVACRLNEFPYLCDDGVKLKDILECCNICGLDYVDSECSAPGFKPNLPDLSSAVLKYKNVTEYNAYYSGTCLTLVKKPLCIVPETHDVPCVDSLVLFFKYNDKRFINVNINMGCLVNSFEDIGDRRCKVESLICFLKKYKDCGAILMTGPLGDLDYDVPQLLYRGDGVLPEIAQRALANGISVNPVPADFPCDLCDPVYEIMEYLLKTCHGDLVPYSWLLQYLRLKSCKKCNLTKLVTPAPCKDKKCRSKSKSKSNSKSRCEKRCEVGCKKPCCFKSSPDYYLHYGRNNNRAQLRNKMRHSDRSNGSNVSHKKESHRNDSHRKDERCGKEDRCSSKKESKHCEVPACVPGKLACCEPGCKKISCDTCCVEYKNCVCDESRCEVICKAPFVCKCDKSKHRVNVDTCKDLCEKCNKKPCCESCAKGSGCEGNEICPPDSCDGYKYCDTLSVLKRELCLHNSLDNIADVNNRYTEFIDHFNRCLDCKYPKGMFQAWAMCNDYEQPCKQSRVIDNNSELLALDHFLVSDCIKNNIVTACLTDLCIEKCGKDVNVLIANQKQNGMASIPYTDGVLDDTGDSSNCPPNLAGIVANFGNNKPNNYTFQYGGSLVRSFFTHRVYCITLDFPHMKKVCDVACGESLHGLGLTSLWSVICKPGCDDVDISVFERFGLDKHPYFKNYFWDCISRRICTKASCANDQLEDDFDVNLCDDNSLVCIQKRKRISEDEFYKLLLCVFSNTDTRDRFIVTIAFMECLYRTDKMKNLLSDNVCHLLNDTALVKKLFVFLSKCFAESFAAAKFVDNNPFSKCNQGLTCRLTANVTEGLAELIDALNFCLKENCLLMEVLHRHTVRALDCIVGGCGGITTNACCGSEEQMSLTSTIVSAFACIPEEDKSMVIDVVNDLTCGGDSKECVERLVEVLGGDCIVQILLTFATGQCFLTSCAT